MLSVHVGCILFNHDEEEIRLLIDTLSRSAHNAKDKIECYLHLHWNSEPSFDVDKMFRKAEVEWSDLSLVAVSSSYNMGFGRAHNKMMDAAFEEGADLYLCLNPDGLLHHNSILNLVTKSMRYDHSNLIEALQFPKEHPKPYDPFTGKTDWCSGACLLIPRKIYSAIGGFDDLFFMYCEDIDLSWRARSNGFGCMLCPEALFFHNVKETKAASVSKLMLESGRLIGWKYGAFGFVEAMEDLLLQAGFYPDKNYLPPLPNIMHVPLDDGIAEWRQLLSFSIPRWRL